MVSTATESEKKDANACVSFFDLTVALRAIQNWNVEIAS